MNISSAPFAHRFRPLCFLGLALLGSLAALITHGQSDTLPVSYYSRTAPGYQRPTAPDGKPALEYYALCFGGRLDGTVWDETQTKEDFPKIAGIVAEHLARQNYVFSPDAKSAKLLITLHWGRTSPPTDESFTQSINDAGSAISNLQNIQNLSPPPLSISEEASAPAIEQTHGQDLDRAEASAALDGAINLLDMESRTRIRRNEETARVIGYFDETVAMRELGGFAGQDRLADLWSEIEENRYYIVITAYDFRLAVEKKQKRPLWSSRISIRTRGNRFTDNIGTMVARAADTFGRNSGRLVRDNRGEVEIGDLQVVENDAKSTSRDTSPPR